MTMEIQSFVHNRPLSINSNEETFVQDFLKIPKIIISLEEMFLRHYMPSDVLRIFNHTTMCYPCLKNDY